MSEGDDFVDLSIGEQLSEVSILKNMIILGRLQLSLTLTLQVLLIVEDTESPTDHP